MTWRILMLSLTDWHDIRQRSQHLAERLSARYPVLYAHPRSLTDRVRLGRRAGAPLPGPVSRVGEGLVVLAPSTLPYGRFSAVRALNRRLFRGALGRYQREQHFTPDVVWLTHPTQLDEVRLDGRCVVYDCMDDYPSFFEEPERGALAAQEERVLRRADIVLTVSAPLLEKCRRHSDRVHLVPNGADYAHFAPAGEGSLPIPDELRDLPRPIVGYAGSIAWWFDFAALKQAAASHPDWSFVLIGPCDVPIPALQNIHWLGPRPYTALPAYLQCFDAAVMPFRNHPLVDSVDPVKVYEYMAAGRPIVSSRLPALERFAHLIRFYDSPESFAAATEATLAAPNEPGREALQAAAREHDWDQRAAVVGDLIEELRRER